jgi:antitoxin component YwqK of YwqJK toxin-antitoxin module
MKFINVLLAYFFSSISVNAQKGDTALRNGEDKILFNNGVHLIQNFSKGLLEGKQIWYSANGNISTIYEYHHGILNGYYIHYYDSSG